MSAGRVEAAAGVPWICAVIACGQPEGQPHVDDCPYAEGDRP